MLVEVIYGDAASYKSACAATSTSTRCGLRTRLGSSRPAMPWSRLLRRIRANILVRTRSKFAVRQLREHRSADARAPVRIVDAHCTKPIRLVTARVRTALLLLTVLTPESVAAATRYAVAWRGGTITAGSGRRTQADQQSQEGAERSMASSPRKSTHNKPRSMGECCRVRPRSNHDAANPRLRSNAKRAHAPLGSSAKLVPPPNGEMYGEFCITVQIEFRQMYHCPSPDR